MKKLIIPMILMLMIIPLVVAFMMPYPIHGKVTLYGEPQSKIDVSFTNVRTAETVTVTTNDKGDYQIELANLKEGYRYGDTVYVKGCKGDTNCIVTFEIEGGSKRIDFPISDSNVEIAMMGVWVATGDLLTAQGFWWFAGFMGLVTYWYRRKEKTGKKMLISFFKRLREGRYK